MPDRNDTIYFVSHTHWDREWYSPFQHFRIRLVQLVDRLLDLLQRDPRYTHFNLDGQTVVLQDYLEIRPEKEDLLKQYVTQRRLGVGPWYVLPDEFLISGEAMVRNLQLGHRIAAEFGHVQKVGYIPDTFGHISQLPQILRGFNIGNAMHFRGLDETGLCSELWWEAPDGSRVLLRHLPTYAGYTSAALIASDLETAIDDLESLAREEARRATTSVLLAMNGLDHMEARQDVPELMRQATERPNGLTLVQSSLEGYFSALEAAVEADVLQVVRGELRDTNRTPNRRVMRVLPNILSSRIYNKQQNEHAQTMLERWAEPWSALMWTQGEAYPAGLLWKAWEWLIKNHPHDSIGGCSVDPVHAQMETRFAWATEIAEMVVDQRLHLLATQIDLTDLGPHEAALILYNGLAWDWDGVATVDIDLPQSLLQRWAVDTVPRPPEEITAEIDFPEIYRWRPATEWGAPPALPDPNFRGLSLRSLTTGEELPLQIESRCKTTIVHPLGTALSFRGVERVRASFQAQVPAFGYAVYGVKPELKPNRYEIITRPRNVLENDTLRVEINTNGTLTITDKETGDDYWDLGYFEDGGDCGDGYAYSNPAEDRVYNTLGLAPNISCLQAGPAVQRYRIDYDWPLPSGLDDARRRRLDTMVTCPLSVTVSLAAESHRVDLEVTFDNRIKDHRLRMLFPSDVEADQASSEGQFDVVTRPIRPEPVSRDAWIEDPPATYPQQSWMDIWGEDDERGFCLINKGIPEFEVLDDRRGTVAITLLRAVAYLAAGRELQTAIGAAGPIMETPEAQIQRQLTFSLAIHPHCGSWDEDEVWRQAHMHNVPPRAITVGRSHPGERPPSGSLLRLDGDNLVLSAVKRSEDGESLIIRIYNPADDPGKGTLSLPFSPSEVWQANLDESVLESAKTIRVKPDGTVPIKVRAKSILTLRIDHPSQEDNP